MAPSVCRSPRPPSQPRGLSTDLHLLHRIGEKSLPSKITVPKNAQFSRGYLSSGFVLIDIAHLLVPMSEFTHQTRLRRTKWRSTYHTPAAEFHQLVPGDLVVHFHNGIGKFLGMEKRKNHLGAEVEFLVIEYADESKLFVPLSQAYLVSRYIGSHEEVPTLHAIGSKSWQNAKSHAQKAIVGYAQELLNGAPSASFKEDLSFRATPS